MSNLVTLRPKPGDVVDGVYHVECELGSDDRSFVLGAVVPATGKRYALRYWLGSDGAAMAAAMQHFVRVANRVKLFDRAGLMEVYGVGQQGGLYYVVSEWLEGTSLQRFMERNGAVAAREAVALLQPCFEGLGAAHAAGIVHGDIRPSNVFLCRPTRYEPERALLYKFGMGSWPDKPVVIRKRFSQDIAVRQFLSPEELQGEAPDERSDVYAAGVMLFQLIAGSSPFAAKSVNDLTIESCSGPYKPLADRVKGWPGDIAATVLRAMATDPAARFADMTEFLIRLTGAQAAQPNAALVKRDGEPRPYTWIRPASEELSPSLFDLEPVAVDEADGREARASRTLRLLAVISCLLMAGAVIARTQQQNTRAARMAAKKRAPVAAQEVGGLTAANSLPAPDSRALPSAAETVGPPGLLPASKGNVASPAGLGRVTQPDDRALEARREVTQTEAAARRAAPAPQATARPAAPATLLQKPAVLPLPTSTAPEPPAVRNASKALDTMRLE